jgi:hypothetical protein
MNPANLSAFVCYGLSAILSMLFGIIYLVRSKFMPYHQEALNKPWQQLDQNLRVLLIGLMRTAGGGLLATGTSVAILLLIPFRAGEFWSIYSIPVIGLLVAIPTLYATALIRLRTHAHTPVVASSLGVGLLVIGFILSII